MAVCDVVMGNWPIFTQSCQQGDPEMDCFVSTSHKQAFGGVPNELN
jgi:hypothetical protein